MVLPAELMGLTGLWIGPVMAAEPPTPMGLAVVFAERAQQGAYDRELRDIGTYARPE